MQTWGGYANPTQTVALPGINFFFFHNKMTLNEITLFKDLLYTVQESDCIFSGGLLAT